MIGEGTRARPDASREACQILDGMIDRFSTALVTTVDPRGMVQTRPLPNTNTEFDGQLWFLSSRGAPLVQDVRAHPEVLITYAERASGRFVVVTGVARLRDDPARARELWHPVLASWLPGGPDDPDLALIQVAVTDVDFWD